MRNFLKGLVLVALASSFPVVASANTPSISGTTIPSATQIVDGEHNVWTLSGGQVYENGALTPSSGVILVLNDGSAIYQENIHHDWWVWGIGGWAASSDPRIVSPNGATIPTATQLVDSQRNIWTVVNGQAYQKGRLTPSSGVILLVYANDAVYQENIHHDWWRWIGGVWAGTSAPRYPSASGTTIPSATQIIDGQSSVWTLSGGQAYRNGVLTPSSGVILLLFYQGSVFQENLHHNWWRWNGSAWIATAADPRAGQPLVYVGDDNYTVAVIDTGTNRIVGTIPVAFAPEFLAVAPNAKQVYVAGNDGQNANTSIAVIETLHDTVIANLTLQGMPAGIVDSPGGTRTYVVSALGQAQEIVVYAIDTSTNAVVATIDTGMHGPGYPAAVAISPDGKKLYVPAGGSLAFPDGSVMVIDTATNSVISSITTPKGGLFTSAAVSPNNAKLYTNVIVPAGDQDLIAVYDPSTGGLTATIRAVMNVGIFSPDSKHLYGVGLGGVAVIDTDTNAATTAVANFPLAYDLAIAPDGRHLYFTDPNTSSVAVADTSTYTISTIIGGLHSPISIAIVPAPPTAQ